MTERSDSCPLGPPGKSYCEDQIPLECKECLQLSFEGEHEIGAPRIGVSQEWDHEVTEGNHTECYSNRLYWITQIERDDIQEDGRKVAFMAECDDCGTFIMNAFRAQCRLKSEN